MPQASKANGDLHKAALFEVKVNGVNLPRLLAILACVPLALLTLLFILVKEFVKRPLKFFSRSSHAVKLPSSLDGAVHENLDVGGGVKLHAVSFGRQHDKPLMLFLHGFPECWYSWRDQLVHFRTQYEVVAVDMRGYNTSSKPQALSAYSLERLTADVAALVRCLGRTCCTLVAHDWGGAVAWAAAGRYPGLVERLVVLAAPHWRLYERNLTVEQMARSYYFLWFQLPLLPELLLLHTDSAFLDAVWRGGDVFSVRRPGAVSGEDVEVYKAAVQQPGAATAALNYYRAAMFASLGLLPMHPEVEAGLARRLDMPVLVVWGANDHALCLSNLKDVGQVAPRSEVHVLPDCSHWIQSDQPGELHRVMDEWLADNPPRLQGQTRPAAKPEPQPQPVAEPQPVAVPEPEPVTETEPEPVAEVEPQPEAEPQLEPEAQAEAEQELEIEAQPRPAPEMGAQSPSQSPSPEVAEPEAAEPEVVEPNL